MKREMILAILAILLTSIALLAHAQNRSPGDTVLGLICLECEFSGQLLRDKTIEEQACIDVWGDSAPRRWYVGRCKRYECLGGSYYYMWDGWTPMPTYNCTNIVRDDPTACPSASCIYIPWISDGKSSKNMTSNDVSRIVQEAMNGHVPD